MEPKATGTPWHADDLHALADLLADLAPADLPTEALLDRLKSIERSCGREPGAPKWGPRSLDLDLLLHGDRVGRVAGKSLPHPDLLTRAWVLGPLAELAPALVHPVARERIDSLWRRFDRSGHPLTPVALEGGEA